MITVYNETTNPWRIERNIEGSVTTIKRSRNKQNSEGITIRRTLSVLSFISALGEGLDKTADKCASITKTKEPVTLTDAHTSLVFNNKQFRPLILEAHERRKDIFLASFFLKGKKVISVHTEKAFLLDYYFIGGELSISGTFNEIGARITVTLLDKTNNKLVNYTFIQEEDRVRKVIDEKVVTEDDDLKVNIKVFRPSTPTYLILAQEDEKEVIESTILKQRSHHHSVVIYGDFKQAVANAKVQHFKAATLFVNAARVDMTFEQQRALKQQVDLMKENFKVVYVLFKAGNIEKVSY